MFQQNGHGKNLARHERCTLATTPVQKPLPAVRLVPLKKIDSHTPSSPRRNQANFRLSKNDNMNSGSGISPRQHQKSDHLKNSILQPSQGVLSPIRKHPARLDSLPVSTKSKNLTGKPPLTQVKIGTKLQSISRDDAEDNLKKKVMLSPLPRKGLDSVIGAKTKPSGVEVSLKKEESVPKQNMRKFQKIGSQLAKTGLDLGRTVGELTNKDNANESQDLSASINSLPIGEDEVVEPEDVRQSDVKISASDCSDEEVSYGDDHPTITIEKEKSQRMISQAEKHEPPPAVKLEIAKPTEVMPGESLVVPGVGCSSETRDQREISNPGPGFSHFSRSSSVRSSGHFIMKSKSPAEIEPVYSSQIEARVEEGGDSSPEEGEIEWSDAQDSPRVVFRRKGSDGSIKTERFPLQKSPLSTTITPDSPLKPKGTIQFNPLHQPVRRGSMRKSQREEKVDGVNTGRRGAAIMKQTSGEDMCHSHFLDPNETLKLLQGSPVRAENLDDDCPSPVTFQNPCVPSTSLVDFSAPPIKAESTSVSKFTQVDHQSDKPDIKPSPLLPEFLRLIEDMSTELKKCTAQFRNVLDSVEDSQRKSWIHLEDSLNSTVKQLPLLIRDSLKDVLTDSVKDSAKCESTDSENNVSSFEPALSSTWKVKALDEDLDMLCDKVRDLSAAVEEVNESLSLTRNQFDVAKSAYQLKTFRGVDVQTEETEEVSKNVPQEPNASDLCDVEGTRVIAQLSQLLHSLQREYDSPVVSGKMTATADSGRNYGDQLLRQRHNQLTHEAEIPEYRREMGCSFSQSEPKQVVVTELDSYWKSKIRGTIQNHLKDAKLEALAALDALA